MEKLRMNGGLGILLRIVLFGTASLICFVIPAMFIFLHYGHYSALSLVADVLLCPITAFLGLACLHLVKEDIAELRSSQKQGGG